MDRSRVGGLALTIDDIALVVEVLSFEEEVLLLVEEEREEERKQKKKSGLCLGLWLEGMIILCV